MGVVFYSGSRMALICSLGMLIVFFVIGYSKSVNKQRIAVIGIAVVVFLVIGMIVNIDTIILEVAKIWVDLFGNRSTLTSEYGRLTIWKTNIEYLISNSKEWIGVGQNQIYLLSKSGLACHNTWLEWICGTGIILGTIIDFWFILAPFRFKKRTDDVLGGEDAKNTMSIIMSYIAIVVCVSSVDNITNPVMLIIMNMLRFGKINGQTKSERGSMKVLKGNSGNSILLAVVKAFTTISGIVSTMIMSHALSLEFYGTFSQTNLIVTTATNLAALGLVDAVNYFYNRSSDQKVQKVYINTIMGVQTITGVIAGVMIVVLSNNLVDYFNNPMLSRFTLR